MQLQRKFRTDASKFKRLRIANNYTAQDLQKLTGLDRGTIGNILKGKPVLLSSVAELAKFFDIDNPLEVLHPDELVEMGAETELTKPGHVLEWEIEKYLSGWLSTSNGLQYQRTQLRHRFLADRHASGKCYEVRHLTCAEREQAEYNLLRHPHVCNAVGNNAHIVRNLTAAKVSELWWVIDEFQPGESLATRLRSGPLSDYELQFIMTGIANGLAVLHDQKIVRRELTPESIWLREQDDCPVLTDLELAKLLAVSPSVAPERWPEDPFRALEVDGSAEVHFQADLYSWGRIFMYAAEGKLADRGTERLSRDLPQRVKSIVLQSVALSPSDRPTDIRRILKALKGWV